MDPCLVEWHKVCEDIEIYKQSLYNCTYDHISRERLILFRSLSGVANVGTKVILAKTN